MWSYIHDAALRRMGYGNSDPAQNGEQWLLELLPERPVVLDVGANVGGYSRMVLAARPEATIHAFEPSGTAYSQLVNVPGIVAHHHGLSDSACEMSLFSDRQGSEMASVHQRDLWRLSIRTDVTEHATFCRLDEVWDELGVEHVDLLKVDVEGHDLHVLRGAGDLLDGQGIRMVQFEFGGANIDSRTFLREFLNLLEPTYRVSRLLPRGLASVSGDEREEVFVYANYVAAPA